MDKSMSISVVTNLNPSPNLLSTMTLLVSKHRHFCLNDKNGRSYQPHWIKTYSSIHYEEEEDLVFCFSCCVYGSAQLKSDNFVSIGFNNWKKAIEKFREHQKTSYHETSYINGLEEKFYKNQF
ncbi:unnamed protein product [Brachionus calyciflorus]|uniref:TTF-type domain-containing protein n=1 Tax=Brachionus calyciflorus TaxID=104777 RepID=A0A814IXG9_9BILA|nr:unnamed protein product [Brachionus calyciflorus]